MLNKDELMDEMYDFAKCPYSPLTKHRWEDIVRNRLFLWGWNEKSIEAFVEWGEYGFNNLDLHTKNTFEDFCGELGYCADRMSLDRLFRCHVLFQNSRPEEDE